jgi:hypothetical protein
MAYEIEHTDEFEGWWNTLAEAEHIEITATVELLEEKGPTLPFPYSSGIGSSAISYERIEDSDRRRAVSNILRL